MFDGSGELGLVLGQAARTARLRSTSLHGTEAIIWQTGADVAGPLLTAYVLWVLTDASRRGIQTLYFLARDGQILLKIANRLAGWLGLVIECRYLYASRQALFLPAVTTRQDIVETCLDETLSGRTPQQMARCFGFADDASAFLPLAAPALDPSVAFTVADRHRAIDAIASGPLWPAILQRAGDRRALLLAYLRQEGLAGDNLSAIVDIGWKGRLQTYLSRAMRTAPDLAPRLPLTGYYFGLTARPRPEAGTVSTFVTDISRINGVILETFCGADHGSVRFFARNETSAIVPVLDGETNEAALAWGLRTQQDAILAFVDTLLETLNVHTTDVDSLVATLRAQTVAAFELFVAKPSLDEARAYGQVLHAQNQTHTSAQDVAPPFTLANALRFIAFRQRNAPIESEWMEASLAWAARSKRGRELLWALWAARKAVNRQVNRVRDAFRRRPPDLAETPSR